MSILSRALSCFVTVVLPVPGVVPQKGLEKTGLGGDAEGHTYGVPVGYLFGMARK